MSDELLNLANGLVTDPINESEARFIAQDWHSGQWSDMYGFASTGILTNPEGLASEIRDAYNAIDEDNADDVADESELLALYQWAMSQVAD